MRFIIFFLLLTLNVSAQQFQMVVAGTDTFFVSKTEITQEEFSQIMGYNPSYTVCQGCPVTNISAVEANNYCILYSKSTNVNVGLLTDRIWDAIPKPPVDSLSKYANFSEVKYKPVISQTAYKGFQDIYGNVLELVRTTNPSLIVFKGGAAGLSGQTYDTLPWHFALTGTIYAKYPNAGFRVCFKKKGS